MELFQGCEQVPEFSYSALDDPSTKFRLLQLQKPANKYALIAASLIDVRLSAKPKYTALSYVWGPETPLTPILVNGKLFAVRQNLYSFLCHYSRSSQEDCLLWIDAICIDQNNPDEKSSQVGRMGSIFGQAHLVVCWLGTHDADIDMALTAIADVTNSLQQGQMSLTMRLISFPSLRRGCNGHLRKFSRTAIGRVSGVCKS